MKNFFTSTACILLVMISYTAYGQVEIEWDKTFGGSRGDHLTTMTRTAGGGYLLGGYSESNASGDKTEDSRRDVEMGSPYSVDYWVVKTNASGQKEWDRTFGGFEKDYLNQVLATEDGGYLLAGYSWSEASGDKSDESYGQRDYWVVKIDASGNKLWDKAYGGSGEDILTTAVVTPDEGFLLGGYSNSNISGLKSEDARGDRDFWVIKIDAAGHKLWDRTYGGSSADELHAINLTADGGFLLGGRSMSPVSAEKTEDPRGEWFDYWVVRIDAAGNKIWDSTFGGDENDVLYTIAPAADGGFLLGGDSKSGISGEKTEPAKGFGDDYWVVRIDASGNKLWDKAYGGSSSDNLFTMLPVADGGFLLGGLSNSDISADRTVAHKGFGDRWLLRIDAAGNQLWDTAVGGDSFDNLWSMIATGDGGALLGGPSLSSASIDKSENPRGDADYWVVKIQIDGELLPPRPGISDPVSILWDGTYGGTRGEILSTALSLPGGRVLLAGSSDSEISGNKNAPLKGNYDYWLVMIDEAGNKLWDRSYGGSDVDYLTSIVPLPDGGFLLGGSSRSEASGDKSEGTRGEREFDTDMWVLRIDAEGNKLWDKTIGGNRDDYLNVAVATDDGGFLLAGHSASGISYEKTAAPRGSYDYWLVKIDGSGNILWDKAYGGSDRDLWVASLTKVGDHYLIGGTSYSGVSSEKSEPSRGDADYWLVMVDAEGNMRWDKTYGGNSSDQLSAVIALEEGGFLVGGSSTSAVSADKSEENRGTTDYWVLRLDASGNMRWDRTYGGNQGDRVSALRNAPDGGFLVGGSSNTAISGEKTAPSRGMTDYWLLKIDASGDPEWDETFGGSENDELQAMAAIEGGLLLAGWSYSDVSGNKTAERYGLGRDFWAVKVEMEFEFERPEKPEKPEPEPTAGHITGGGWFYSPMGAYEQDPFVQGRAVFSFSARQRKEAEAPGGHALFLLPDARLSFHSRDLEWIAVQEDRAFIKGIGRLGREEGYHFLISVQDRGQGAREPQDRFRITIWDPEENIVYDNQQEDALYAGAEMEIQRGNIVIHDLKKKAHPIFGREQQEEPLFSEIRPDHMRVYPSRLQDEGLWLEFPAVERKQELRLTIYDVQGREMSSKSLLLERSGGKHLWSPDHRNWPSGMYLLRISGDQLEYQQKLLK